MVKQLHKIGDNAENKISVIIPVYNAEKDIEKCAESIFSQTFKDLEIIFINDGSTDKTPEILEMLVKDKENCKLVHQENKGLFKTRQIGLMMASGDYIGWVDSDDFIEPTMYEELYNEAIKKESDLVICNYKWFPKKIKTKEKWFREYKGKLDTDFVERNSQPWNKIIKKDLLLSISANTLFEKCFDEIYIKALIKADNPVTLDKELYNYRVETGSMSSSYTNINHYKKFVKAAENLKEVMKDEIKGDKYWEDYFNYRIIYYTVITMLVSANSGDKSEYELNKQYLLNRFPKFYKNQHYNKILKKNYGNLKSFIIGKVIPSNYFFAKAACIGIR